MLAPVISSSVFHPSFVELGLAQAEIEAHIGYVDQPIPVAVRDLLAELLAAAARCVEVACGYAWYPKEEVHVDRYGIRISGVLFDTGNIITARLKRAKGLAAFIVTAGQSFQHWYDEIAAANDVMAVYLADAIGSEIAERACDWVHRSVEAEAAEKGMVATNRYSPGYCNWPVSDQHLLFTMMPAEACGVRLNESALMWPVKSVSGIIGFGKNVQREQYDCEICSREDCLRRRHG
jgi:hypothetical protein